LVNLVVLRHVAMSVQCFNSEDVSACQSDKAFRDVLGAKIDLVQFPLQYEVDNVGLSLVREA